MNLTPLADSATAIRSELRINSTITDLGLDEQFETAAGLLDTLVNGMEAAKVTHTAIGLAERLRTLSEPIQTFAEVLEAAATSHEKRSSADFETVWNHLQRPAATAEERAMIADRQARLERSDVIHAEAYALFAAKTGLFDDVMRAVATYPSPPLELEGATWRSPISPRCLAEMKVLVRERLSPQGSDRWTVQLLRSLAASLRAGLMLGA